MNRLDPLNCSCNDCLVGDSLPLSDIDLFDPTTEHMALLLKVAQGSVPNEAFDMAFTAYYPKDIEDLTAIIRVYNFMEDEASFIFYNNSEMGY